MNKKLLFLAINCFFAMALNATTRAFHDSSLVQPSMVNAQTFYRTMASGDPLPSKKFIFSVALTPYFGGTIPPVSLYFEKGIAKIASLGMDIGASYEDEFYQEANVLIGLRACGYVFPMISKFSGKNVKSMGFDPYAGLAFNYIISAYSELDEVYSRTHAGLILGSRWYVGDKRAFALLAEFATSGIRGSNVRVGISLGR